MLLDILKGFIIGICASAPIGPVAILVIQKTLSKGHKAGFITGLGATFVDTVFSMIALSALAIAISASCSDVGKIFTAQSPKTNTPFCP